jgi:hypothetical protein
MELDAEAVEYATRIHACRETPLQPLNNYPLTIEDLRLGNLKITVLRDDLLCGGTKSRVLYSYLLESGLADRYLNFVYVSPWYGGAQIALAWTCALLKQERNLPYQATIFYTTREDLGDIILDDFDEAYFLGPHGEKFLHEDPRIPPYTKIALFYGAQVFFVPEGHGYRRAREYIDEYRAHLLPSGFRTGEVIDRIANLGKQLVEKIGRFDECWCAVGSGALIQGLQRSGIAKEYIGLCVFRECGDIGRALGIIPEIDFNQTYQAQDWPPFPSALHYDAKIWPHLVEESQGMNKRILYWNVM